MESQSSEHNSDTVAEQRQPETPQPQKRSAWPYLGVAAVVIAGGLIWWNPGGFLGGIGGDSGKAVATVNGAEITSAELDERVARVSSSVEAQGGTVEEGEQKEQLKRQVLETLVNEELLLQAGAAAGVSASDEEIQEQLTDIRSRFPSEKAYRDELSSNSFTEESFRENVRRQIVIQTYLAQRIGEDAVAVTDEEIAAVYEQVAASSGDDAPSLEQVREQLRAQIRQQKLNNALGPIVSELRDAAEIEILI